MAMNLAQSDFFIPAVPSSRERFEAFDAANPRVYDLFERFALEAIRRGKRKLGGRLIIERIRWEYAISTDSDDGFKINGNHAPFYVRKFIRQYPGYRSMFELRASLADG